MEALDLLLNRRSAPRLQHPAPTGKTLEQIIAAGLRAPDHATLQPWRFVIAEGEGLTRLSTLFYQTALHDGEDEQARQKARQAPLRAPMIITVIAHCTEHAKVPDWEQWLSAGCAVHAMQMAAIALGFNGIWRTGHWADHPQIRTAFSCRQQDKIVGFLYLGTCPLTARPAQELPANTPFVRYF